MLQAEAMNGMIAATLETYEKLKWTALQLDVQEHVALPMLMQEKRVKQDSGYNVAWELNFGTTGHARFVGLFETDVVNATDNIVPANVPWRHVETSYAFDRREPRMNAGAEKIVCLIEERRANALVDASTKFEEAWWGLPTSSGGEFYGIKYWIVWTGGQAFDGGIPSGFSDVAGVSPTTYPRWKNWSDTYTLVTKADLIYKMRLAARKTKWKAPIRQPELATDYQHGVYTNLDVIQALEDVGEAQNENLGRDIASMDGQMLFHKNPIVWVPQLDDRTADPIYLIDWGSLSVRYQGEWMSELQQNNIHGQHNVTRVFVDWTLNTRGVDRRRQAILAKGSGTI